MTRAVYNELDAYPAEWLRNLIAAGHIAPGVVDERSIADVRATDLAGAVQFHTFAGIGVWSHALRLAGWPDDRPVWTGSCPCQPFSAAGKGGGFDDARHLWPEWFRLIRECRPPVIFGEQVASGDGLAWLDLVQADLEGAGYAVAAFDLCAAGFGAPHIRQRLYFCAYFVANADGTRREFCGGERRDLPAHGDAQPGDDADRCSKASGVADDARERCEVFVGQKQHKNGPEFSHGGGLGDADRDSAGRHGRRLPRAEASDERRVRGVDHGPCDAGGNGRLEYADDAGPQGRGERRHGRGERPARATGVLGGEPGPVNGFWRDAEWIPCQDPARGVVYRAVEPGTFPLAHGAAQRVGRLRAYGNAIVAPQAAAFVRAVMDVLGIAPSRALANWDAYVTAAGVRQEVPR